MAINLLSISVGNGGNDKFHSGKPYNVYDTYAHALAQGATGLSTIYDLDHILGTQGTQISQVAKSVGVLPDQNGRLNFYCSNSADIYLKTEGLGIPIRVASTAW